MESRFHIQIRTSHISIGTTSSMITFSIKQTEPHVLGGSVCLSATLFQSFHGTNRTFEVDNKIAKFLNRVLTFARHNVIIFMPDKKE